MEREDIKEVIKQLKRINLKIDELKEANNYLIAELKDNANIDDLGIESSNLNQIKTKISNIKIDISNQVIPKLEEEASSM